jgi:hypothetical protein
LCSNTLNVFRLAASTTARGNKFHSTTDRTLKNLRLLSFAQVAIAFKNYNPEKHKILYKMRNIIFCAVKISQQLLTSATASQHQAEVG